ncbi:MAG: Transposase IS200-like protein [Bacteroidetes bacterium]|nr:Transposase IS200-like protein [Bacteroidota bacterium]
MIHSNFLCHIILKTKKNQKTLSLEHSDELYKFIWGVLNRNECILHRINGMEDHIHLLATINPELAFSDLIKEIKRNSTIMLKMEKGFEKFKGWDRVYGVFTLSVDEKEKLSNIIKNQREYHKTVSFKEEFEATVKEAGLDFDPKSWEE